MSPLPLRLMVVVLLLLLLPPALLPPIGGIFSTGTFGRLGGGLSESTSGFAEGSAEPSALRCVLCQALASSEKPQRLISVCSNAESRELAEVLGSSDGHPVLPHIHLMHRAQRSHSFLSEGSFRKSSIM